MTFLRDPVERAVSHFHHWRRHPNPADPVYREIEAGPGGYSLDAFIRHPSLFDLYVRNLSPYGFDGLAFVGITEQFDRSVALLSRVLNVWVVKGIQRRNTNADRQGKGYSIDAETRAIIEKNNAADVAFYRLASERFERDATKALAKRRWVWPNRWR